MSRSNYDFINYKPFESSTKTGRYSRISASMLKSEAWIKLKAIAVKLYIYLKLKYMGNPHNIEFQCTYKEINQHIGFNDTSIKSAYDDLIKKGFIKVIENNQSRMKSNKYKFSDNWQYYNNSNYEYIETQRKVVIHKANTKENLSV
jgi:hypothetical protein